jgi:PleD family two-component response regulator
MLKIDLLFEKLGIDSDAKINVLVVDDDRGLCSHVVKILEKTNIYHCQSAFTVADAVKELKHGGLDEISVSNDKEPYLEKFRGIWRRRFNEVSQEELLVCILGPASSFSIFEWDSVPQTRSPTF